MDPATTPKDATTTILPEAIVFGTVYSGQQIVVAVVEEAVRIFFGINMQRNYIFLKSDFRCVANS